MRKNSITMTMVLVVVFILGIGAYSFAQRGGMGMGMGYGHHGGYHHGDNSQGYGCPWYSGDMSQEELNRLNTRQRAFFNDTAEIRQSLNEKTLALQSEFAKPTPDKEKALSLQKEISNLEAQLDQKWVEYQVQLKKENPGASMGFGSDRCPGMGRGYHHRW